jgi:hypothetical protein
MRAIPQWARHPAVIAAFVAGLFAILVAVLQFFMKSEPRLDIIVQVGGLYRDPYYKDEDFGLDSWQVYIPKIHNQERFWIGLHILPRKDVTVDTFSVSGIQFELLYLGYLDKQEGQETLHLHRGQAEWIAVPVELNRWVEFRAILSSKTVCLLLDTQGTAVGEYELPATEFPQE